MIIDKKKNGSYYTPKILADFLVKHIFSNNRFKSKSDEISILEPSCGDGKFIAPLLDMKHLSKFKSVNFVIQDTNRKELNKTYRKISNSLNDRIIVSKSSKDFLFTRMEEKFDLIIGNPPYISKTLLRVEQIEKCKEICNRFIVDYGEVKNIWASFLLKCANCLKENGVLCFVLPSELLQVNYTKKIRSYLLNSFAELEIFAFNELIFQHIEQDVIVLIAKKKARTSERNISFFQVEKLEDLKIPDFIKKHSNVHRKKLDKWTNYILQENELNKIEKHVNNLNFLPINHFCKKAEVGIVTAANDYFILRQTDTDRNKLNYFSVPILKRGSIVKNLVNLTEDDIEKYRDKDYPINFIRFRNFPFEKQGKFARQYILKGEQHKLHKRYKMTLRENWFHIPSIWYAEGLFLKRSHLYPRIIVTQSDILATDSFYRILMKDSYNIKNLAFSFYNTLTFILSELEGRFYGGGVLELIPSEFKNLMIPYKRKISESQFNRLDNYFRKEKGIEFILDYTDSILFPSLSKNELKKLRNIWKKLVNRRLKNSKT